MRLTTSGCKMKYGKRSFCLTYTLVGDELCTSARAFCHGNTLVTAPPHVRDPPMPIPDTTHTSRSMKRGGQHECHRSSLPALPAWMISPVCGSVDLKTGQPAESALAMDSSNLVPMILKEDLSGSMDPNSSILVL